MGNGNNIGRSNGCGGANGANGTRRTQRGQQNRAGGGGCCNRSQANQFLNNRGNNAANRQDYQRLSQLFRQQAQLESQILQYLQQQRGR